MNAPRRRASAKPPAVALAVFISCGCSSIVPRSLTDTPPVPTSSDRQADPAALKEGDGATAASETPEGKVPAIAEGLLKADATATLAQIIDIALQNNPLTRTSYRQARAAAAALGSRRAPFYPNVDLSGTAGVGRESPDGRAVSTTDTYGAGVDLTYLLLDLGGRSAEAEEARQSLIAADWTHNATIQDVILQVETSYVLYLNAKAQLEAAKATAKQARTALDAATRRKDAGLGTIADVLQAATALSQARLDVERFEGEVLIVRGVLATSMGLPATTPYDVGTLPADMPLDRTLATVDEYVARATVDRPDLAALRALAERAAARVRAVRSQGLPTLSLSANANRTYYDPDSWSDYRDNWSAGLLLSVPVFTGFANTYDIREASEEAEAAKAQVDTLEQQVILEVWTSYYGVKTATQVVKTSRDLLASAEQSERVALGRYKEGVGTIIDLLVAQSALADARAQEIRARSAWFVAVARLARDTGRAADTNELLEGGP